MAQLLSSICGRFSCREFAAEPISKEMLESVIEAGRIAPSGFGMEPWRFIVVQSSAARVNVEVACQNQAPVTTAPVLIALVALVDALAPDSDFVEARLTAEAGGPPPPELQENYRNFYESSDVRGWAIGQCNFAAAQMMTQATALGLASCAIGGFDEQALALALGLGQGEIPALVLALGHCAQQQGERKRRPVQDLLQII